MKKVLFFIFFVLILFSFPVFASSSYEEGSTLFSIRAGYDYPVLIQTFEEEGGKIYSGLGDGEGKTNLTFGLVGASLSYEYFNTPVTAMGGEIGYYTGKAQEHYVTFVPLTFKFSYLALNKDAFYLFLHTNAGVSYASFNRTNRYVTPVASATVNALFEVSESWNIGLETGVFANFELHFKESMMKYNTVALYLPVSLVFSYKR